MSLENVPFALRPYYVILSRLIYHSKEGSSRLLDGLHYDKAGQIDAAGDEDLPFVQPITIQDEETVGPGAGDGVKNDPTFYLLIGARRENGIFRMNQSDDPDSEGYEAPGVLDWVGKVRDALETKTDGSEERDALLDGTISKPLFSAVREAPVSDLTWCMLLEVTFEQPSICRGERSLSLKEIQDQ